MSTPQSRMQEDTEKQKCFDTGSQDAGSGCFSLQDLVRQDSKERCEDQCRDEVPRLELADVQQAQAYHKKKHTTLCRELVDADLTDKWLDPASCQGEETLTLVDEDAYEGEHDSQSIYGGEDHRYAAVHDGLYEDCGHVPCGSRLDGTYNGHRP